jgi:NADH-quinone oxidoreductase subunit J
MTRIIFLALALLSVLSGLMVVFSKNPIHSVLFLILTFFSITGEYILLKAQFLAIVNVIVYAGAIMVLFLFVIMLLNLNKETEPHKSSLIKFLAAVTGGMLLVVLVACLKGANQISHPSYKPNIGLISNLGKVLFSQFLLPFEISALLFLAAMVGAVMLGKKDIK